MREIIDRWFAPSQRWFKVEADDGQTYVIRHGELAGDWELAALVGHALPPDASSPRRAP